MAEPLLQFSKCDRLWRERFSVLLNAAKREAERAHMPICLARLEECEKRILDLLVTDHV